MLLHKTAQETAGVLFISVLILFICFLLGISPQGRDLICSVGEDWGSPDSLRQRFAFAGFLLLLATQAWPDTASELRWRQVAHGSDLAHGRSIPAAPLVIGMTALVRRARAKPDSVAAHRCDAGMQTRLRRFPGYPTLHS